MAVLRCGPYCLYLLHPSFLGSPHTCHTEPQTPCIVLTVALFGPTLAAIPPLPWGHLALSVHSYAMTEATW